MSFRFKLYRILTALVLIIAGFFTIFGLLITLFAGTNPMMLLSLFIWGAGFIHSILSLYLQRSWLAPGIPLKENTPTGIRITGVITLIFGIMLFFSGAALTAATPEMFNEVVKQMPTQEADSINPAILRPLGAIFLVLGLLMVFNVNLSFSFLRKWKQRQDDSTVLDDIN
ncbi:MAG TPA: hypothetical protein VM802_00475 [Chitinophaga sp.]|uniref:hypothetical protein n=1 Tax=Chitinophaga sp. TaxID=1869181 RepID=UPI002CB87BE6|nr:hypothetical protein [Chitinophaga sp.]HVI43304.1 hypothetical protein [Chitinophaga sp.]